MKLPLKLIVILVLASLLGTFAYQAYWLTGLYRTMQQDVEQNILETMRMSDYNEMMLRIEALQKESTNHGEISVSAGYNNESKSSYVESSTIVNKEDGETMHYRNQRIVSRTDSISIVKQLSNDSLVTNTPPEEQSTSKESSHVTASASLQASGNELSMLIKNQNSMLELATYFQRGLHSGLDVILKPNIAVYDSLLTLLLQEKGIQVPYQLEHLYSGATVDSSITFVDTLALFRTPHYTPSNKARHYIYAFDIHSKQSYRLTMEPTYGLVLKQMSGILITSFIILIILSGSFWFLIRTILRQKTLEEMKSDFTNNITHELKTPIAVAYAANDALLNFNQAENKEKREKYLLVCQEQLQRLSGLVEQILSMSMERRKSFRLHPEMLSIWEVCLPLIEQHKLKAEKPIHITLDIQPESLTILADRTHFGNILSNLIDNGIKYSLEQADLTIHCRKTEMGIEISVTDLGIGIPAEKQALIFDKFYRIPTGNIHNTKGYGLGLFYVKTMVEKHKGSITVKSTPGHGSTFTLYFPA